MRLDKYLVKSGMIGSRSRAKFAIKSGWVRVDGKVVTKPSFEVEEGCRIEIERECDKPLGYWKLKELDEKFKIIERGSTVLDLGSSAGGFLMYASEVAGKVIGIEISKNFRRELKRIEEERGNVRVIFDDVFKMKLDDIPEVDVILNDLTLDPSSSIKALRRFIPKLKEGGKVLCVLKGECADVNVENLKVMHAIRSEDKEETYVILKKISQQFPSS